VSRPKVSRLVPVGLLLMSAATLTHNWMHDRFSEFVVGALIGVSIVMMIVGTVRSRRPSKRGGESRGPCDSA